jgi:hypothetical protein
VTPKPKDDIVVCKTTDWKNAVISTSFALVVIVIVVVRISSLLSPNLVFLFFKFDHRAQQAENGFEDFKTAVQLFGNIQRNQQSRCVTPILANQSFQLLSFNPVFVVI